MESSSNLKYYDLVLQEIADLRERNLLGKLNCIPLPFSRFRSLLPGIEKSKYYIITANQKIGKSKLGDKLFVYHPLLYAIRNPDKLKVKIFYFTLEISKKKKYREMMCHLLYQLTKGRIRISTLDLESIREGKPLPIEILEYLNSEEYRSYMDFFENSIEFIPNISNPTGINKYLRKYASDNGKFHYRKQKIKEGSITKEIEIIDRYEQDDPEEYRIVIIDNYSNLSLENGYNKQQNIEKMSKYCITLRDQLGYTIVGIQHQAQAQEGIENFKLNKLKPSSDGLADCKLTSRDANMVIGLYSPYKYGLENFEGYDIRTFKNYIRFLEVIEDRDCGANNNICPLFFDGAVSEFVELPRPNAPELEPFKKRATILQRITVEPNSSNISLLSIESNKLKVKNGNNLCNFWRFWRR